MLGTPGILLAIATPQLPQPVKVLAWLLYIGACIATVIHKNDTIRRWRSGPAARTPMTLALVVAIGAVIGGTAGLLAWLFFPVDNVQAGAIAVAESGLKGDVQGVFVSELTDNAHPEGYAIATFYITVRNVGDPSIAERWKAIAILPDGRQVVGIPQTFQADIAEELARQFPNKAVKPFAPHRQILKVTNKPIQPGDVASGYMSAIFPNVPVADLFENKVTYAIQFQDVKGAEVKLEYDPSQHPDQPPELQGIFQGDLE